MDHRTRQRFHNATGTGELTTPSGSQPKARVTHQATYHDEIGRQIAVAEYGTYGGATFSRAAVVPNRTDTILVTSMEYDSAGNAYKTVDPAGKEHRTEFDDRARRVKTIQNYVDGNPATGGADEDVTVEMTYNADGQLETLTAKNPTTGDQTTTYVYGTTLSDSEIATTTLKRAEIYPDSDDTPSLGDGADSTYDRIELKYDRQQRVVEVKDQQETVHAFDFDALGRQTQDRVTTLGSGVDGDVRRIATTYDVLGRREKTTSYDNPTVGSGSIVNEVQSSYNDFGQLVTEYQEHGGAVNTGTSLKVQYAYAYGSSNTIRPTKMTYPDGRELNYDYGSAGSAGDALSRVASLIDDDGSTHLVNYSYLGRITFVKTDYAEPDLRYDLAMGAGDDPYDGFDRFGRVADSRWYDYGSSADADRILYGYDRASNRTYREQTCDTNSYHDEVYGYDDVNRLTDFDRGTINGNKDAISTLKFAQQWNLDPTGNWSAFKEDDDGDSSWDIEQARTSNEVNEITNITETSGPAWVTPAYNRAGNMTTIPKPADPTASFAATYDAWNRLVKLEEGEDTVAEYVYDGAKRRVVKKNYDSGELDETRHFYYTANWQVIEERVESSGVISANPNRQFVWGPRYVDQFVLRDRDTNSNGTLDERLYALQDANWNVTALADTSGDVQERYAYSAYGMPRVLTPTFTTRASSTFEIEVLYAGYRYDATISLYQVRHRVYQSKVGCWVQRDQVALAISNVNLHRYADNMPSTMTDAAGLQSLPTLSLPRCSPQDCTACVKRGWEEDPVLKHLRGLLRNAFGWRRRCKPNITCCDRNDKRSVCARCTQPFSQLLGEYDPENGTIALCGHQFYDFSNAPAGWQPPAHFGSLGKCSMVWETMRHEVIHQLHDCRKYDPGGKGECGKCICDELKAHIWSGQCYKGSIWYELQKFKDEETCAAVSAAWACAGKCGFDSNASHEQLVASVTKLTDDCHAWPQEYRPDF